MKLITKKNKFRSVILSSIWSNYDKEFISSNKDTISLKHDDFVLFQMDDYNPLMKSMSKIKYYDKKQYPYLMNDKNYLKSVQLIEAPIMINWNFRNFPFDEQKLKYRYTSTVDTSIIKLSHSSKFPSSYSSQMENLKDG